MLVVKDAMVLIHLAKLSLLETCCDLFSGIIVPTEVKKEVVDRGREKGFPDAIIIDEIINKGKISVKEVQDRTLVDRANQFNIQGGEAEAVALYWELDADLLATDDDNVRKKKTILDLKVVGTLPIILKLFMADMIDKNKFERSLSELRKIGWFSSGVLDRIAAEADKK